MGQAAGAIKTSLMWLNGVSAPNLNRWAALRAIATVWLDGQPNLWQPFPHRSDALALLSIGISSSAVVWLIRSPDRVLKWFVLSLIAPLLLGIWLPAFLGDRTLATTVRYQLPTLIAVQVAAADWLTTWLDRRSHLGAGNRPWQRPQVWAIALALCLLWANFTSLKAQSWQMTWWSKGNGSSTSVAKILKKVDRPLVISAVVPGEYWALLSYSASLQRLGDRTVAFWVVADPENPTWPDRPHVLTISPSPILRQAIERQRGPLIPVGPSYLQIWRVRSAPTR
jgi:hypothetical protein